MEHITYCHKTPKFQPESDKQQDLQIVALTNKFRRGGQRKRSINQNAYMISVTVLISANQHLSPLGEFKY